MIFSSVIQNRLSLDQTQTYQYSTAFQVFQSSLASYAQIKKEAKTELRRSTMTTVRADVQAAASRQSGLWTAIYPHCKRI